MQSLPAGAGFNLVFRAFRCFGKGAAVAAGGMVVTAQARRKGRLKRLVKDTNFTDWRERDAGPARAVGSEVVRSRKRRSLQWECAMPLTLTSSTLSIVGAPKKMELPAPSAGAKLVNDWSI